MTQGGANMAPNSQPLVYPVLPLKSTVLFPHILMPVSVGRPQSVAATEAALAMEGKTLIAAVQRAPQIQTPDLSDLFSTSTLLAQPPTVDRSRTMGLVDECLRA